MSSLDPLFPKRFGHYHRVSYYDGPNGPNEPNDMGSNHHSGGTGSVDLKQLNSPHTPKLENLIRFINDGPQLLWKVLQQDPLLKKEFLQMSRELMNYCSSNDSPSQAHNTKHIQAHRTKEKDIQVTWHRERYIPDEGLVDTYTITLKDRVSCQWSIFAAEQLQDGSILMELSSSQGFRFNWAYMHEDERIHFNPITPRDKDFGYWVDELRNIASLLPQAQDSSVRTKSKLAMLTTLLEKQQRLNTIDPWKHTLNLCGYKIDIINKDMGRDCGKRFPEGSKEFKIITQSPDSTIMECSWIAKSYERSIEIFEHHTNTTTDPMRSSKIPR